MRKTKIICTIGPKTHSLDQLKELIKGGMNVARLNMSHGEHAWHAEVIQAVRKLNDQMQTAVALMVDTKGAEVRMGDLKEDLILKKGDPMIFTERHQSKYQSHVTEVSYDGFAEDVSVGDLILIDGGVLSFKVKEVKGKDVITKCVDGGTLTSRRHINVRGKSARLPSITDKDWKDIDFAIEHRVDFIALSFVKDASSIVSLKNYLAKKQSNIAVIAKIESAESIPHLGEILEVADGAMVARGDLGAELPIEEVPLLQEEIVRQCRELGKPVIIATHLLESMIQHPTPTRAEVMDITQAVREGADAIMLSGETASGLYPHRALEVMHTVAGHIEKKIALVKTTDLSATSVIEQIVRSASHISKNIEADAILVFTSRGYVASLMAKMRPNCPIFAFTPSGSVLRKMSLYYGVRAFEIDFSEGSEETIQVAIQLLKDRKIIKKGAKLVLVADLHIGKEVLDILQVRIIQ